MHSQFILIASLAGSVTAIAFPEANARMQNWDNLVRRQVASSVVAASSNGAGCSIPASVISIVETLPTPPPDLSSALAASSITDYCNTPSFTGTLSAEYSSYEQAVLSWALSNSAVLASAETQIASTCPQITSLNGQIPVCQSSGAPAAMGTASVSGSTAMTTGTTTKASTGSTTTSAGGATHSGAAPAATMMAAAGAVLAGAMGILVL